MTFNLFDPELWFPVGLSLACGLLCVILSIPWGIYWGWIFARKNFFGKHSLLALLYLPLVLPPVLTGYLLLLLVGHQSPVGSWLLSVFQLGFVFDWKGLVLCSFAVSAPFMIEAMRQAFVNVNEGLEWTSRSLGADTWKTFARISLPLASRGVVAGSLLVFARSIGEFGATLILAGNIPGKNQTVPLAIFSAVQSGEKQFLWPWILFAMFFAYAGILLSLYFWCKNSRFDNHVPAV